MIEIQHINKAFGDKKIIDDVSAQFKPGRCNLIIGASGSGKTVLVKCIVDLIQADQGKVFFDQEDSAALNKAQKKALRNSIGMLFQGGGMKKRVGLARALVLEPKYLFCDEPNSGLDPQTSIVIDHLIQDLTKEFNITTLVVTHDMNSVMEIGEYIIYLHKGKKEWEGSNQDIIFSQNKLLNDFIFASGFLQDAKAMRMMAQKK